MAPKARNTPPLPERVAAEFAHAERVASARKTLAEKLYAAFTPIIAAADASIRQAVEESMEVLLYALVTGNKIGILGHSAVRKHQPDGSLKPQSHPLPPKPTAANIIAQGPPQGQTATTAITTTGAQDKAYRTTAKPKQTGPKLPRFALRLQQSSPLHHADTTVARAIRETAPPVTAGFAGSERRLHGHKS